MSTSLDRPRDVFLDACAAIGIGFSSIGFEPRAHGQRLIRRRAGFGEEISFHSSFRNVAGEWIAMWPAALIRSADLKNWRTSLPAASRRDDVLAAGRVENIADVAFGQWNLADAYTRGTVISSVVDALESKVLPWFDLIEDDKELLEVARHRDVPCFDIESITEYAVFLGQPDTATKIVRAWLDRRGERESSGYLERLRVVVDHHGLRVDLPKPRFRINLDATAERLRQAAGGPMVIK
jgi:hypothetical protein